jgi:hypothetical protein
MADNSSPLKYPPRVERSALLLLSKNIGDPTKNIQRFSGLSIFSIFALVVVPTVLMINALNAYGSEKVKSASIIPTYKSSPAHQAVTDLVNNLWGFMLYTSLSEPWNFLEPYWKYPILPIEPLKKPSPTVKATDCNQVDPPQQIIHT